MHGSRKRRIERTLPRDDVPRALIEVVARAGEGLLVIDGEAVELADCASFKISIRHSGPTSQLKVTLRYPEAPGILGGESPAKDSPEEPAPGGLPRYKGLKKRMKSTFRAIRDALLAGAAPDAGVAASFVADSRLMTRYPGKGDAYYAAYDAEVDRFEQAQAAGDVAALTASAAALDRLKKECHSRHA